MDSTRHIARHRLFASGILALSLIAAGSSSFAAEQDEQLPLGPTVTRTDTGPTGYEVTFRYEAPANVDSVQIYGEWFFSQPDRITTLGGGEHRIPALWQPGDVPNAPWKLLEMNQGDDGIWELKVPLPSGTFSYSFTHECPPIAVDSCQRHADPANPGMAAELPAYSSQSLSQVFVPENPNYPTYDNAYQAPRPADEMGTFVHETYETSYSLDPKGIHPLSVYLPRGYDPDRAEPYPVMYLSHGFGGNDTDWFTMGSAPYILENAIDEGAAEPTIIVATNFNGLGVDSLVLSTSYGHDMVENVIPFVEDHFNVSTEANDRAFAGLSLGGARAIELLTKYPGTFEYYGLWSAGKLSSTFTCTERENIAALRGTIHVGTGLQDHLFFISASSPARAESLRNIGVDVAEFNLPGIHSWDIWRAELNDFIRNVAFKKDL